RTHCQTSGWSLTQQDPFNNVGRTSIEAMAAVFGGTQSLHTNALDEAIALPTDFSARIARNTQLHLQLETQVCRSVDPWAGSHHMEGLTQNIAGAAWKLIEEIEALGGMTQAIEEGIPKMRIEGAAAKKQARIDRGQDIIVGLSRHRMEKEDPLQSLEVDNTRVRKEQMQRLAQMKRDRDQVAVDKALANIRSAAQKLDRNESDHE